MPPPSPGAGSLSRRLSTFYFFYYATVGAFIPYWSLYLAARGLSPAQMGVAYALMGVMRIIVPLAWGWYADRRGKRMGLIRYASVCALLMFLGIPFTPDALSLVALMVGYTLLWHALLPQFEVVAWNHLRHIDGDYGRVRLWGSIGFILAVLGLGAALDVTGVLWLPWLVGAFWLGMALTAWSVPEPARSATVHEKLASVRGALRAPGIWALLLVCFCSQLSFAPYYNFFSLFLERHGHARTLAGSLWAIAVIAEVVLFIVIGRLIQRYSARRVMQLAMLATVLRWGLTPLAVNSLGWLAVLQLGHALSFGAYHAVAMYYLQHFFPGALQGRGQAIYNAVSYGLGGSLGSLAAGYLWEAWSPDAVFYAAAGAALIGLVAALRALPRIGEIAAPSPRN